MPRLTTQLVCLLTLAFWSAPSAAQNLSTLRLEVRKAEVIDHNFTLYFTFLDANQQAIKEVPKDKLEVLTFDGQKPLKISKPEVELLSDSKHPVAVMFVVANYRAFNDKNTKAFAAVAEVIRKMRNIDVAGVVYYADSTRDLPFTYDINSLAESVGAVEDSDVPIPRVFAALSRGVRRFESEIDSQKVDQRYLVLVSDGYGPWVGSPDTSTVDRKVNQAAQRMKELKITPLIVGYTAVGEDQGVTMLRQLASRGGGTYRGAEDREEVFAAVDSTYHEIYDSHVFAFQSGALEAGQTHKLRLHAKVKALEAKSPPVEVYVPESSWGGNMTLYLIIGGGVCFALMLFGGIGLGIFIFIKKRKAKQEEEEEYYEEEAPSMGAAAVPMAMGMGMASMAPVAPQKYDDTPPPNYLGKLSCTAGPLHGRTYYIVGETTTIGSAEGNSIVLGDGSVSKKHAGIRFKEGKRYELHDFGSTNGVFINGKRISKQFLRDGDKVKFGDTEVVFTLE